MKRSHFFLAGTQLSSKDGSAKVVKAICEKAGIEFTESLLTWKPTEFLDPTWTAPATLEASDVEQANIFGFEPYFLNNVYLINKSFIENKDWVFLSISSFYNLQYWRIYV